MDRRWGRMLLVGSALALLIAAVASLRLWGDPRESSARSVALDHPFRFNAQGQLPVDDVAALPVAPGAVSVRWYTLRGWYAAVFEGLDPSATGGLCLGASIRNEATGRYEYIANSTAHPIDPSACADDHGAGAEVLGRYDMGQYGGRVCDGSVAYITRIPSNIEGTLLIWLAIFPPDGTGIGVSSQFRTTSGRLRELAPAALDCAPLPDQRQPVVAPTVITAAPASTGAVSSAQRQPAPAPTDPGRCFSPEPGTLQDIRDTDAAPYLLHVPPGAEGAPVVMFLPGGSGTAGGAQSLWNRFFADRPGAHRLVVVIPYVNDGDLITDTGRLLVILDEVLWCTRANPQDVHLAGTSNGGLAAFALMTAHPEYFVTLLGAPGAFPVPDPSKVQREVWAERFAGRAVFNGVGAVDSAWHAEVMATHNALAAAGVESVFVEFAVQGHVTDARFDPSPFFEFWSRH